MKPIYLILFLYISFWILNDSSEATEIMNNPNDNSIVDTNKLIPIDKNDTNFEIDFEYATDTVTPNGWTIKYLVKNNSRKYNDLYIQWSKGNNVGIFNGEDVLLMRSFFIPVYLDEDEKHIYLNHGCATQCDALLVLSKENPFTGIDYTYVVDYNIALGKIVYIPERIFKTDTLVSVMDLISEKEKPVVFKNNCDVLPEYGCIDSIEFNKNYVKLYGIFNLSAEDKHKNIRENHIVRFDD